MGSGDPALIICLCARGNSRAIGTHDSDLIGGINLLGAAGGLLGALATLAAPPLLGEEGGDPCVVDEVNGSAECTEEDKIQEDAKLRQSVQ